jgi:hypothetical protein
MGCGSSITANPDATKIIPIHPNMVRDSPVIEGQVGFNKFPNPRSKENLIIDPEAISTIQRMPESMTLNAVQNIPGSLAFSPP